MKKVILSIFAVICAMSVSLGTAGCNKKAEHPPLLQQPPQNDGNKVSDENDYITETAPYYTTENPLFSDYNWSYANGDYETFINYLNNSFKPNSEEAFYLWTPGEAGFVWYGDEYNSEGYNYATIFESFRIYADMNESTGALKNSKTLQNIIIYSADWKDYNNSNNKACVQMTIITRTVDAVRGELNIGFGEYENNGNKYNFANVYIGENCVATCLFYWNNEEITLEWCDNYIKNHLVLWN